MFVCATECTTTQAVRGANGSAWHGLPQIANYFLKMIYGSSERRAWCRLAGGRLDVGCGRHQFESLPGTTQSLDLVVRVTQGREVENAIQLWASGVPATFGTRHM
jgi:hypothetical protein